MSTSTIDRHALTAKVLLGLEALPERGSWERDYFGKHINLVMVQRFDPDEPEYLNGARFAQHVAELSKGRVVLTVREASEYLRKFLQLYPDFPEHMREITVLHALAFTPTRKQ